MVSDMVNLHVRVFADTVRVISLIFLFLHRSLTQETVPAPISVPPSTNWDGNDGPWSSFVVSVGSPAQSVRVLPSSSGSSLWTVLPDGCLDQDASSCPESRGRIFNPNSSSTWTEEGFYQLPLLAEAAFNYSGRGRFGYDSFVMSFIGDEVVTVNKSIIVGIKTKDFYIGILGLTPYGTNFTDFNDPKPSILKLLRDSEQIPSRSWAYTAGAYYTPKKTFGSLVFGGYDTSRFVPNDLTVGLGPDISRDILVGVQSIKAGEADLLDQGIITYIDSTISHIWLPISACQKFERVFGLTWDPQVELYLVNETLHSKLVADNPTVIFTIGSSINGGKTVLIEMPYGAFDLEARDTFTSASATRYFPLRRAQNETQYALGRAFLQQAYLIVDYDRNNFSVSQALFPDTGVAEHRVAILDPSQNGTANSTSSAPRGRDGKLATPAIVGISLGSVAAILLIVAAAIFYFRRRRSLLRSQPEKEEDATKQQPFEKAELDGTMDPTDQKHMPSSSESEKAELAGSRYQTRELAVHTHHTKELSGTGLVEASGDRSYPREMAGSGVDITELEGSGGRRVYYELP